MSPQIQVTPPLLDVRPDIIKRGKELFGPEGIDETNKGKTDSRYQGLPEFARPQVDSQSDKLRQPGTLLDPLNVLGLRERTIDRIIEKGGQGLINSYDSQTGKYGGLSGWNRTFDGVNDDDITKGILRRNERMRQSDPEFQENLAELKRQGVDVDSLTSNLSIKDQAKNFKKIKTKETTIRGMPGGTEALKGLGDKPTLEQLQSLETKLKPKTQKSRETEAGIGFTQAQTAATETDAAATTATAAAATTNAAANTMNANTSRISALNSDKLANAKLQFENQKLDYERQVAMYGIDSKTREANLDRTLRKDLAILGLEDKKDDRRYNRERDERKDRQLMIMQLLGGLKNLGSSFAL
jgi:hypothetical protein